MSIFLSSSAPVPSTGAMSGEVYLERKGKGGTGIFTVAMIRQLNFFFLFHSILALRIHVLHSFSASFMSWVNTVKDSLDKVASRPKREGRKVAQRSIIAAISLRER